MLWPMFGRTMLTGMTALLAGACTAPAPQPDFDAAAPLPRLMAIQGAGAQRDPAATRSLIEQLDSDDAAVRMLAYEALRRIDAAGPAYDPGAPPACRRKAVAHWVEYVTAGTTTSENDG
jgi:hypothetical protein